MPSPFFTPWVGRLYGGRGSVLPKRVMVLGASHYCGNGCRDCGDPAAHPECAVFTRDVVRDYLSDECPGDWKKTFTTFINSAFGRATTADDRRQFMDSIVFANFLQRSEGRDANEKHNEYFQLPANLEALKATISERRPDVVVTWGDRVWNAIPWDLGYGKAEKVTESVFRYPFEDRLSRRGVAQDSSLRRREWQLSMIFGISCHNQRRNSLATNLYFGD